jgi:hypothetical protein
MFKKIMKDVDLTNFNDQLTQLNNHMPIYRFSLVVIKYLGQWMSPLGSKQLRFRLKEDFN